MTFDPTSMPPIDGLVYRADYLTPAQHDALLQRIDQQPWQQTLARRTQHYGYRYDYRARRIDASFAIGPLPDWLHAIAHRIHADGLLDQAADQAIINEYAPGQGIADHIDCTPCFADGIASLSLAASTVMRFTRAETIHELLLQPRSLLVLRGPARYDWRHGIPRRHSDIIEGRRVHRGRRVSMTFRTVCLD